MLNHIDETNDKRHLAPVNAMKIGTFHTRDKEMEYSEVAKEFGINFGTQSKPTISREAMQKAKKPLPAHKAAISSSGSIMYIDSKDFSAFIRTLMKTSSEQLGAHYICLSCWIYVDLN
jgi:hypothetical protein